MKQRRKKTNGRCGKSKEIREYREATGCIKRPDDAAAQDPEKQKQEEDKQKIRIVSESASNEESEETPKE